MKNKKIIQRGAGLKLVRYVFTVATVLCFHTSVLYGQQAPLYSQYMFNMLYVNPAYAGARAVNSVNALYRNQWVGLKGSPKTTCISFDKREEDSSVGYGVQLYNDQLGVENSTGLQGFYSYRLSLKRSTLAFGLSAGLLNYKANYDQTNPVQTGDPALTNVNSILPTAGFGVLYSMDRWYAGFSIPALLKTRTYYKDSISDKIFANNHYFLTGGYIFDVSDELKVKPSVLFKKVAGSPVQMDLNINAWLQNIVGLGLSYRTGDAVVGMAEVMVTPKITIGYAYDFTISSLNQYNQGTHELMLRYEFDTNKVLDVLSPRYY